MKKFSPVVIVSIVGLSKCFWIWDNYYFVFATILGVSKRDLMLKYPREVYQNKYSITESILRELDNKGDNDRILEIVEFFYGLDKPYDKEKNIYYEEAVLALKDFKKLV